MKMSGLITRRRAIVAGFASVGGFILTRSLSGLGVCEQALMANTTAKAAAMRDDPASHLDSCMLKLPSPDLGRLRRASGARTGNSPRLQAS